MRPASAVRGLPIAVAAERVVRAFLAVKAERAETSRLRNRVFGVGMLDDRSDVTPIDDWALGDRYKKQPVVAVAAKPW